RRMTPAPGTPAAQGYRMPAEWEPHAATWLAWPHERSDWPGPGKLEAVRWVYVEIGRHLGPGERVRVLVQDERLGAGRRARLARARCSAAPESRRIGSTGSAFRPIGPGRATTARSSSVTPPGAWPRSDGDSPDGRSIPTTSATRQWRRAWRAGSAGRSGCRRS